MAHQSLPDYAEAYKRAFLEANLGGPALSSFRELERVPNPPDSCANHMQQLKILHPDGRDGDIYQQLIYDREQKRTKATVKNVGKSCLMIRIHYLNVEVCHLNQSQLAPTILQANWNFKEANHSVPKGM
uniref:Uncharacterized protein n=1 Tax=Romanomermis culicivorax TaxID=13658 RepID=A0A915HQJ8_ROMCU